MLAFKDITFAEQLDEHVAKVVHVEKGCFFINFPLAVAGKSYNKEVFESPYGAE